MKASVILAAIKREESKRPGPDRCTWKYKMHPIDLRSQIN